MASQTSQEPIVPSTPAARKGRSGVWIIGGVAALVALLVLAGGALAAGRLSAPGGGREGDRAFGGRPEFQITPAQELPSGNPAVRGIVTGRDNNVLSIGQRGGFGGNSGSAANLTTVTVAADTTIYHDTTQMNPGSQQPGGAVQQTVEPGTLDGIQTNSRVTVWGDSTGNQIAAKVLVYSDPINFRQP